MERSREFLDGLRRELPIWEADGLVTPGAARALAVRYELDEEARPGPARERSGALAAAAGLAVTATLAVALLASGLGDGVLLPLAALAAAFAATPLATRGDALAPAARALRVEGRVLFYLAAYALSFVPVAEASRFHGGLASEGVLAAIPPLLLAGTAVAVGLRRADLDPMARGEAMLLAATVVAFAAGLSLDTGDGTALVATMALCFLAVGRVMRGLHFGVRAAFFEGIAVAGILVATKAFDVFPQTWAVVASALCVLGAVVALVAFERRRTRAHPLPARAG
jgi:hypothetical protein